MLDSNNRNLESFSIHCDGHDNPLIELGEMQYYAKIEGTDSFTNHVSNLKRDSSLSDNALQRLTTHSCETLHTIIRRSNC